MNDYSVLSPSLNPYNEIMMKPDVSVTFQLSCTFVSIVKVSVYVFEALHTIRSLLSSIEVGSLSISFQLLSGEHHLA